MDFLSDTLPSYSVVYVIYANGLLGGQTFHVTVTIRSEVKNEEQGKVYELCDSEIRMLGSNSVRMNIVDLKLELLK